MKKPAQVASTSPRRRARTLAVALSVLIIGTALYANNVKAQAPAPTLPSTGTIAVPTYESVGLYWQSPGGSAGCEVKYRKAGTTAWAPGLAMWYDARDTQCRGSLVSLAPNTYYQVEFNLPGQAAARGLVFQTWSNQRPVSKTITVSAGSGTLNVAESGTAAGYVVYDGRGATLDAQNVAQYNVTINASYVIVRGLALKGAKQDAIRISPNVKDVIIEDNDISGWGRTRDGTWGTDMDSGIRAVCSTPTLERVTIQRNKIHDPRYGANSWSNGHPAGPQAITISYCGGNHVIRHNEMYSNNGKRFNDVIGGEDNFTKTGFPNADTDIYGNRLSDAWDDAIEAEGANENVRIWGNYMDKTAIGIATTVTSVGPTYLFRNVYNRSQFLEAALSNPDGDDRQVFFKSGSDAALGNGRRYIFHNTMLQMTQAGESYGLGAGAAIGGTGSSQPINNTWSKNNIFHLWKPNGVAYQYGTANVFATDLYNGHPGEAVYTGGMQGTPAYAAGNGPVSGAGGMYQLATTSPGYGRGTRIANFNDDAAAPDVGAHQSGTASMKFGLAASSGSAVGTGTVVPPPTTPPPPPSTNGMTVSVSALVFGATQTTQVVTYTNNTAAKVFVSQKLMSSTKFGQTSTCGVLGPGASCTANVTYYPNNGGSNTGTFTVVSNAPNSPHVVQLTGGATITAPAPPPPPPPPPPFSSGVTLSATSLQFGTLAGKRSVLITNRTAGTVTFNVPVLSSTKFTQVSTCGVVAAGATCAVYVAYYPANAGSATGTLTIPSNAPNSPHVVTLNY